MMGASPSHGHITSSRYWAHLPSCLPSPRPLHVTASRNGVSRTYEDRCTCWSGAALDAGQDPHVEDVMARWPDHSLS